MASQAHELRPADQCHSFGYGFVPSTVSRIELPSRMIDGNSAATPAGDRTAFLLAVFEVAPKRQDDPAIAIAEYMITCGGYYDLGERTPDRENGAEGSEAHHRP